MTVPIHHRESAVVSITFAPAALLTLRFEIFQQSACQKCLILSLITCEIVQILFIEQCSTVFCNEFYFYPQKFRYVRKATYLIQSLLSARLLTKLRVVSFNFNSPFDIAFSRDLIVQIIFRSEIQLPCRRFVPVSRQVKLRFSHLRAVSYMLILHYFRCMCQYLLHLQCWPVLHRGTWL
jgi:hypothetical protein